MAKIVLITDTHFGARSDSQAFDRFFRTFFERMFFPYLDAHKIDCVIHLGDVFDRRKYINFQTLKSCMEYFWEPMRERGIHVWSILGNHDTAFKNTNEVNSQDLLLKWFPNVEVIQTPQTLSFAGLDILMVPWICEDNIHACTKAIEETKAKVCFGHFEIVGFEMYRGTENQEGFDPKSFQKFDLVASGHFHHRSNRGNITYLGSPYEMTWADYDDPRGFHILDTETGELEFIQNPFTIFHKVYYDDTKNIPPAKTFSGSCVKLVVVNKTDFYAFDKYVDALYQNNVLELKIIEDLSEFEAEAADDVEMDIEDTMGLLSEYVDSLETDVDRERLKVVLKTLYVEAQGRER